MIRKRTYTIEWEAQAARAFKKIKDRTLKDHILRVLEQEIAVNPLIGKPLTGPFLGVRSYRIGVLRVLYKPYADRCVIIVLRVDHRKEVYR